MGTWPGLNSEFRGPVTIAGLPEHLATVPTGITGPDDPLRVEKKQAWIDWEQQIRRYRVETLRDVLNNPALEGIERRRCVLDPLYFMAMYGYLYEPRKGNGRGGFNPWVPFERQAQQVRWWQWTMEQEDENADGVLSKCRDVGASWTMVLCFTWAWRFEDVFSGLFVSQKEEFVDSRHPKALFWKMDQIIRHLPPFLRPVGFNPALHRIKMFLLNPENGNTIGGETTTSRAGRGDRVTDALFDEAAQIPDFMNTWMGAADSTEHRHGVSTESLDEGPDFYNLRTGVDAEYHPAVFTIDHWEHPLHDDKWFERQVKRYAADPDAFQREIMRDPHTRSQFVYPQAREKFPVPDLVFLRGNPIVVSIDPGFDDATAIVVLQQNVADGYWDVLNGYTNNKVLADFYGPILCGSRTTLDGEQVGYDYTAYEDEFIDWMADVTNGGKELPIYYGDTYGNTQNGASADTWYSMWHKNHNIIVNRDRLPNGKANAARMQLRTHPGRRKALRWILPKVRFGDTTGARQALLALQNNSFPKPSRSGKIPESGMLRDNTTHYTSALEYFAANTFYKDLLMQYSDKRMKADREREEQETVNRSRISHLGGRQLREIA